MKPISGERGIRTPGTSQCDGFQDRCNRPLYHLSFTWLCDFNCKASAKVNVFIETIQKRIDRLIFVNIITWILELNNKCKAYFLWLDCFLVWKLVSFWCIFRFYICWIFNIRYEDDSCSPLLGNRESGTKSNAYFPTPKPCSYILSLILNKHSKTSFTTLKPYLRLNATPCTYSWISVFHT